MQSSRGQINAENLRRQDRSFVEDYAERYDLDLSKPLPTEEIISRIFIKGRKTIPILQHHIWEGDEDRVELTGRLEFPQHESLLADDQPQQLTSSRLFLPETFPPPPNDTYTPSHSPSPAPPDCGWSGSDPASAYSQGGHPASPPRMAFTYPPQGRPHRDSKGRVREGHFEPLPENWLHEMLCDFERGRNDLTSDLEELMRSVKDTSYQVLNLYTEIKSERRDIKIFVDAIEKVCGNEILNQIKADARATVLASRESPVSQNHAHNGSSQGRVRVPVNSKKKVILGTEPLPTPSSPTGTPNATSTTCGVESSEPGKAHPSGIKPIAPRAKRSFDDINDECSDGAESSSSSSDSSSNRNKRTKRTNDASDDDEGSGSDDSDAGDDSAPKPGGSSIRQPDGSEESNGVVRKSPSPQPQLVYPDAHPSRRHTHTVPSGRGNGPSSPGPSTVTAAPRRGRPLTRQYNVWFSLEDPPAPSSTSPEAGTPPETTGQTTSNPSPESNQAEPSIASAAPVASTSAAASGSSSSSVRHRSPSAELPPNNDFDQFFRNAGWNRPAPAPSNLRRRPLRRENERIAIDPITNRIVAYDNDRDGPDFSVARAAQAEDDIATIRRLAEEMEPVVVLDEEPDFMDDEEVVLGEHDDLPV